MWAPSSSQLRCKLENYLGHQVNQRNEFAYANVRRLLGALSEKGQEAPFQ
jgi:hypothetical protein